jgi:acetyl esterase
MKLRELSLRQPRLQALAYPVTTRDTDLASMREHAEAPLFGIEDLHASFDAYIPGWRTGAKPGALPMDHSEYGKLAPAFIGLAEFDPVVDHGAAYAEMLKLAGVPVKLYVAKGMIHGCLRALGVDGVELLYDAMSEQLAIHLACG